MRPFHDDKPVFSFYGDDFTGSTDALEALSLGGIPTVLFLKLPDAADLAAFSGCRAVGVAGDSRTRSPEWMRDKLPGIFGRLREMGAPIVQYKICSTFDSSPEIGSIGCAMEIGQDIFGVPFVPVVAAAPRLGRYVVFGNLFASGGGAIHRIDRHPTMKCHPVTPMGEADLRLHLSHQTARRAALMDLNALDSLDPSARFEELLQEEPDAVVFDGLDGESLAEAAQLIWNHRASQAFVVGSSGFTAGMVEYWVEEGWIAGPAAGRRARGADRLLVLAGSCSPVTRHQICHALRDGFCGLRLDAAGMADPASRAACQDALMGEAEAQLKNGRSVVLYTALAPGDFVEALDRRALGEASGKLLRELIRRSGVERVVVAGGDTSSHAVRELGITALTFESPIEPGAPLCRAHGHEPGLAGLELVLKGGQVGAETFFEAALRGC